MIASRRPAARAWSARRDAAGRVDAFVDRRDNDDLVWVRVPD